MLTRIGQACDQWARRPPWGPLLGLGRTVLAVSTALTLTTTGSEILFSPAQGRPPGASCWGMGEISLFCVVPNLELARWIGVAILVVVASGWRPRVTSILHWIVAFSFYRSATVTDGGDQIASNITLLLLPVCLLDPRRWHWEKLAEANPQPRLGILVAWSAVAAIKFQVAGVYLNSGIAKLGVESWADGTALHYILLDPTFGAPAPLQPMVQYFLGSGMVVAALTWGAMLLEISLGLALLLHKSVRTALLVLGLLLHAGIALLMGITTFSLAMIAALLLYILPPDSVVSARRILSGIRFGSPEPDVAPA